MLPPMLRVIGSFLVVLISLTDGNQAAGAQKSTKPNLILILADDLGFETIGANGGTSYKTPNLDKLASTGIRFTHCYSQPLCTPTRVQLMTGIYNVRNYTQFGHLDPKEITFGNYLRNAGYSTCITGKWQLGQAKDLPHRFGFDEHCLWQHTRRPPRYANPGLEINGKEQDFKNGEYGPDILNNYAMDFVKRKKDGPFFLYYPMTLTHSPYQPTPDSLNWNPRTMGEQANQNSKHFGDMVAYMDKLIGKLIEQLESLNISDNTLVIFVGDNGTGKGTKSMMGDRTIIGGKGTTTIAGMHVPLIASWPGYIKQGRVCDDLVDSTDFAPTLLEAAGLKVDGKNFDGSSFLPQLLGQGGQPRQWVYSWYSPRQNANKSVKESAFNHNFKLYRTGEFFDLKNDPEESKPLQVSELKGQAASTVTLLQSALGKYSNSRPKSLDQNFEKSPPGKGKSSKRGL